MNRKARRSGKWDLLQSSGFARPPVQELHGAHFLQGRAVTEKGVGCMPKILLAEDNPADVYLIRAALEEHGVDVPLQVAAEGSEVLRLIEQQDVPGESQLSLIILDLNLPRHDGIEILQRLREKARVPRIPVVVLTSSDSPRDRIAASELGAAAFLRKPSNLEQFLSLGAVFKEVLQQARTASGGI
jgi:CheY-like chemotaxis protein